MTIHSQVSAFGALLLLQSEIEVNETEVPMPSGACPWLKRDARAAYA